MTKEQLTDLYWMQGMTTGEIGKMLGMPAQSIWNWMKKYDIPVRPTGGQQRKRKIDGVWHKLCKGPLHRQGVWIPMKNFYKERRYVHDEPVIRSECKDCETKRKNYERLVNADRYLIWLEAIVERLGVREAARRTGIPYQHMTVLRARKHPKMTRATARKIVNALAELKQTGEVRHRDSIRHGAYLRGRQEKIPKDRKDFYHTGDGDAEMEYRRKRREIPEVREREAERTRQRRAVRREAA